MFTKADHAESDEDKRQHRFASPRPRGACGTGAARCLVSLGAYIRMRLLGDECSLSTFYKVTVVQSDSQGMSRLG